MTITGLVAFLRKLCPGIEETCHIEIFEGCRIAMDVSIYMYSKKASAIRNQVKKMIDPLVETPNYENASLEMCLGIVNLISYYKKYNITVVPVFDGKSHELKKKTQDERRAKTSSMEDKISNLKKIGKSMSQESDLTDEEDKYVKSYSGKHVLNSKNDVTEALKMHLSNACSMELNDYVLLKQTFDELGIPWIQAEYEAEQTCAIMCKRGDVAAVMSTDSDVLAYGAPIMINSEPRGSGRVMFETSPTITAIAFSNVLNCLNMNYKQFLEFCIMLGTDFNKNVRGMGPAKCHELLTQYKCLDNINNVRTYMISKHLKPKTKIEKYCYAYDSEILNLSEVMAFFTSMVSYDKSRMENCNPIENPTIEKFLPVADKKKIMRIFEIFLPEK